MIPVSEKIITHPHYAVVIQENIPLQDKTWFNTGGNARYYAQPSTAQEFAEALLWAQENNLAVFVLGKGANVLISDEGFDGLVIHPNIKTIHVIETSAQNVLVTAGAGVQISDLIEYCLSHQIIGLEEFSGIPGTVGGSVYINLHYFEFLLEHFLVQAQVIHKATGRIETVSTDWFCFGYNQSTLQKEEYYLLTATFSLKKVSEIQAAYAHGRSIEITRHRHKRYPIKNTCGSFFRNFHEHEVTLMSNNKKMIYVAYYLDKTGIKGQLQVGDAIVSYQHANMIVNQGKATSTDIINLARTMQEIVRDQFTLIPQPECKLIGFKQYPLLR